MASATRRHAGTGTTANATASNQYVAPQTSRGTLTSPSRMRTQPISNQPVIQCHHDDEGEAPARISPPANKGVSTSDDGGVEEDCSPCLTGDEGTTEDADKETHDVECAWGVDGACETGGDGADDEESGHDFPWSITWVCGCQYYIMWWKRRKGEQKLTIDKRTDDEADEEGGAEGDDVRVP